MELIFSPWHLLVDLLLVIGSAQDECAVNVAVLLPNDDSVMFSIHRTLPAIELAREGAQHAMPHQFRILVKDSMCNAAQGLNQAITMYNSTDIHVFLGPCCDYSAAPVARQAFFWNIPMLTAGAMAGEFLTERQSEYPLLMRVHTDFNSMAGFLVEVMQTYNWSHSVIIYDPVGRDDIYPDFCQTAARGIHDAMRKATLSQSTFQLQLSVDNDSVTLTSSSMSDILEVNVGVKHAVVMMCASPDTIRNIMVTADSSGFNNGEYVFINIDLFSSQRQIEKPWYREWDTVVNNTRARRAYEPLLTVTLRKSTSEAYKNFSKAVKIKAREMYGNHSVYKEESDEEVNSFVGAFHDAFKLYSLILNQTIADGGNISNGTDLTERMRNFSFQGITGTVTIDGNGDRNADFTLLDLNPELDFFQVVGTYNGSTKRYTKNGTIYWTRNITHPVPLHQPRCGYDGSLCRTESRSLWLLLTSLGVGFICCTFIVSVVVKKHKDKQRQMDPSYWEIKWDEVTLNASAKTPKQDGEKVKDYTINNSTLLLAASEDSINMFQPIHDTRTGIFKGNAVAIKKINLPRDLTTLKTAYKKELKELKDMQNDNVTRFLGVCAAPNSCIVTEYCPRGSLQDILSSSDVNLDNVFKFSLIQDIISGMCYLHTSEVKSHGKLKSSNCVIDARFSLKITDFGLNAIRPKLTPDRDKYYQSLLWTAPELLRMAEVPIKGTQKADIYSFAIICQEVLCREGPFSMYTQPSQCTHSDYVHYIITQVQDIKLKPFRPCLPRDQPEDLLILITKCWDEDPFKRPEFTSIKTQMRKITNTADVEKNILDNLLNRMEVYSRALELLVEERTEAYLEEKRKAEEVLYSMLPRSIAGQLMKRMEVKAQEFKSVTIYFSDIAGFTDLGAISEPMEIVNLLNDLYTCFDTIIGQFDVYKVETIGDAYMLVSGLPQENGINHAREIARAALAILDGVRHFKIKHLPQHKLEIRIGIHSGPVCAGVVGKKMPRYCLFGDTVNTASRMESTGQAMKIHVHPDTKALLDTLGNFQMEYRGEVELKNRGTVKSYWLLGERHSSHLHRSLSRPDC